MTGERLSRIALACLVEPGHPELGKSVRQLGASTVLDRILTSGLAPVQLTESARATLTATGRRTTVPAAHDLAETVVATAQATGARVITPADEEWPVHIEQSAQTPCDDGGQHDHRVHPPLCLWVRGAMSVAETLHRSVAVVGARAATSYGEHVAADLAGRLANHGWTVVSGGAFGIDAAAHRATLVAAGRTVAILAAGIDRAYPAAHAALFEQIAANGLMLSAWPPGTQPYRTRFAARSRMIAAATRGAVLVEAGARSSARTTLHHARLLRRPAMVVPGPVTSALSVGCHAELREHPQTRLVCGAADVIAELATRPDDIE